MPDEISRKTSMRRVTNPDDETQFVDIKVIDEITFFDPKSSGQEIVMRFNNKRDANRKVHTQDVRDKQDDTLHVETERVDEFTVQDPKDDGQEKTFRLTGNGEDPPKHESSHKIKIHSKTDPNVWIEMQRIDKLTVLDPKDRGQETTFTLSWLDDDETNKTKVDKSDDGTSINPPWRFDPFQTIVGVQWAPIGAEFITIFYELASNMPTMPVWEFINFPFAPNQRFDLLAHEGLILHDGVDPVPAIAEFDPDVLFPPEMLAHLYAWTEGAPELDTQAGGLRRGLQTVIVNTKKLLADFPNGVDDRVEFGIAIPQVPPPTNVVYTDYWTVSLPALFSGTGLPPPRDKVMVQEPREVIFTSDPNVPFRGWSDLVFFPDLVIGSYPIRIHGTGGDAAAFYNANRAGGYTMVTLSYYQSVDSDVYYVRGRFFIRPWHQVGDHYEPLTTSKEIDDRSPVEGMEYPLRTMVFKITPGPVVVKPKQTRQVG